MRHTLGAVVLALVACNFEHGALRGGPGGDDAAIDAPADAAQTTWWDPAWSYRMPLTIANSSTSTLPIGYQIGFSHMFNAAPCTGTPDDVRFVFGTASELNRVFDNVGPPQWAWFPLQAPLAPGATSTGEYWMYCGNPSPGAGPSTPKTLFDFYDGFGEAAIDTAVWTVNHSATLSGGKLVCGNGAMGDNGVVTTTPAFTHDHAVDFIAQTGNASTASFWAGFQLGTADVPPWLHWWTNTVGIIAPDFRATDTSTLWLGTSKTLDTAAHLYTVENYGMKSMYRLDDVVYETHDYDVAPPATLSVRLWNGNATPTVAYDWVRVRQAVDPPPAVTVGTPEPKPLPQ